MKKAIVAAVASGCLLGLWIGTPPVAMGQPALERLEQRIRERLGTLAAPPPAGQVSPGPRKPADSERGWLGATVDDQNDRGRGVRVLEVRPGGPADKAGLRTRDLIVSAAGIRVRQMRDLSEVLDLFPPGDTATLEVMRDALQQRIRVTLGRRPPGEAGPGEPAEVVPAPPAQPPLPAKEHAVQLPPQPQPPTTPDGPQLAPPAPAGRPADAAAALIEQLQRRIEQLERRIEALEKARAEKEKTEKR